MSDLDDLEAALYAKMTPAARYEAVQNAVGLGLLSPDMARQALDLDLPVAAAEGDYLFRSLFAEMDALSRNRAVRFQVRVGLLSEEIARLALDLDLS